MIRCLAISLLLLSAGASAHKFDSAFVSLSEQGPKQLSAHLKLPLVAGRPTAIPDLQLPASCQPLGEPRIQRDIRTWRQSWQLHCASSPRGSTITMEGLNPSVPNAVIALRFADGAERILLINRDENSFVFAPGDHKQTAATMDYLPLGITHILGGPDHLLFVAGLLLVVQRARLGIKTLVGTITAFTLAHSLTLAGAVLGHFSLPANAVEAVIALSILLLAVELSVASASGVPPDTLTFRKPWLIAFGFGLIHGFGFAGALREVGLPEHAVGWALLLFNVGVEIGQLMFVGLLLVSGMLLSRLHAPTMRAAMQSMVIVIGTLGAFWVIERSHSALVNG